jgi:hypothetical protein
VTKEELVKNFGENAAKEVGLLMDIDNSGALSIDELKVLNHMHG